MGGSKDEELAVFQEEGTGLGGGEERSRVMIYGMERRRGER